MSNLKVKTQSKVLAFRDARRRAKREHKIIYVIYDRMIKDYFAQDKPAHEPVEVSIGKVEPR